VETTSKNATSGGTAQTPEKATGNTIYWIDKDLVMTEAYWYFVRRLHEGVDLTQLSSVQLDSNPCDGQAIYGAVYAREGEPPFYIVGHIPGPFPAVLTRPSGQSYHVLDQEEAILWILSHELCHFMKRTKQLPGPNDEDSACDFADSWLSDFRKNRMRKP
jgi:hypothetical protein